MNSDPLKQLLHEADRSAGTPRFDSTDLPLRVRSALRARRRTRRVGAVATIGLAVGAATLVRFELFPAALKPSQPSIVAQAALSEAEIARLRSEIARLEVEAAASLRLVRRLTNDRRSRVRLASYRRAMPAVDPVLLAEREADTAARIMVYRADRIYRETGLRTPAMEGYRRTIELFPRTPAADVARRKLHEFESRPGEST